MKPELNLNPPAPELPLFKSGYSVRFKTEAVNPDGSVVALQEGHNEITDWGMDALASTNLATLCNYLHLGSTLGTANRIGTGSGTTLSLAVTSPASITVTASAGFFVSTDASVGATLSITGLQEMKITAFTSATQVTCATRQGFWISGSAPGAGPYNSFGVHFTNEIVLAAQFTKFNSYDTAATNYNAELNDSGNSRFIQQRIFLSSAVTGSAWTVNQLGWSDGNASNNVFGKVNLASPDTVAIGQKYRVTLQVYSAYTPINIASFSANFGPNIGTYDLAIRQESIARDVPLSGKLSNLISPWDTQASDGYQYICWYNDSPFTLAPTKWEGDAGYQTSYHAAPPSGGNARSNYFSQSAYTSGTHTRTKTLTFSDTFAIAGATGFAIDQRNYGYELALTFKLNSSTFNKPAGYQAILTFPIVWTRQLTN